MITIPSKGSPSSARLYKTGDLARYLPDGNIEWLGRIKTGLEANLLIFKARYFSELLSRPQWDRLVIRRGLSIDTTLPDYQELDDLVLGIEQIL